MSARGRGRGGSLVEALIAVLVMGFGLLAVAALQGRLRHSADAARQRAEAVRMAQAEMERLRSFVALTRSAELPADALVFAEIADGEQWRDAAATRYHLVRRVQPLGEAGLALQLQISWRDASQRAEDPAWQLAWHSALAAQQPRLALAARQAPAQGVGERRVLDRHPAIPLQAHKLDTERSLLRPLSMGRSVYVLDNASGEIRGVCEVDAATSLGQLRAADIAGCAANLSQVEFLLSGQIRFAEPPPASVAAATTVSLRLDAGDRYPGAARCDTERSGSSSLRYHCRVPTRLPTLSDPLLHWSGRSLLEGLALQPGGWRVCRYSDDVDGNGRIDNAEHPADYRRVDRSLVQQNFLVMPFASACPSGQRVNLDAGQFRNTVALAHQP